LKRLYQIYPNGSTYKQYLIDNAEKFGFTKEQVMSMKKPILVRRINTSRNRAIVLGNYEVLDLETGNKGRRMNPVAVINQMSDQHRKTLAEMLLSSDYDTVNKAVRANTNKVINLLKLYVQPSLLNNLTKETDRTELSADGVNSIVELVNELMFNNADIEVRQIFDKLPNTVQKNLELALPSIYDTAQGKSLLPVIHNAIVGVYDFVGSDQFWKDWLVNTNIFKNARPLDIYTPLELDIIKRLSEATKQSELKPLTKQYADLVRDKPADLMTPKPTRGVSIENAIKQTFNVEAHEKDIQGIAKIGNKKNLQEEGDGPQVQLPKSEFPHKENVVPFNLIENGKVEGYAFNSQPGVVPGSGKYAYDPSKPYPPTSLAYKALEAGFSESTGMAVASNVSPASIEMLKLEFPEMKLIKSSYPGGDMLLFYDQNGLFFNPFKLKTMLSSGAATDQDRSMLEQHENFALHENVKLAQTDGDAIAYKVMSNGCWA
jgi:hypothetical protein